MTKSDISAIETQCGVVLPDSYRALLIRPPFGADSIAAEMLVADPGVLLAMNRLRPDVFSSRKVFAVGNDGAEKQFFLDLCSADGAVLEYDLETGKAASFASTLEAYVSRIRELDERLAAEEIEGEQVASTIPRWKQTLSFYLPALVGLLFFFVVMPIVAHTISRLIHWMRH